MPTTATSTDLVRAPDGDTFTITYVRPGTPNGAGILLLQEIFGVGPYIKAVAHRLARAGYLVAAPDLFWRLQRNWAPEHDEAGMAASFEMVQGFDVGTGVADCIASLAHIRGLAEHRRRR